MPRTLLSTKQLRFLGTIFLVLACLTLNWANILTFNFTVICMTPKSGDYEIGSSSFSPIQKNGNTTLASLASLEAMSSSDSASSIPLYMFTTWERSQALSVVAIGALVANFPIVVLINWHGPRLPFALLGLLGAFATAAIPFSLTQGFYWFLLARFVQGVAFAGDMATFGHFLANWTEHKQYAFLTATLALYVQLAPFFTFPAAGILCNSSLGWPGVYYAHAIVSLVFFSLFAIFYHNKYNSNVVEKHKVTKSILKLEMNSNVLPAATINEQNEALRRRKLEKKAKKHIPFREILRSKAVWAIFISAVGDFTAVNLLYQFTPTYLYAVQGFKVMETGLMATLPPFVQAVMKELAGLLNDRIPRRWIGETAKTKIFNSIALISTAVFLLALSLVPIGHGYVALLLITLGEAFLGFIVGGFYKNGPQLAGLYGPFVMGQVSTALTLTMLVVPFAVSQLTYGNTIGQWAIAFCLVAIICILSNFYYITFAKAEPEYWATLDYYEERKKEMKKKKDSSSAKQ